MNIRNFSRTKDIRRIILAGVIALALVHHAVAQSITVGELAQRMGEGNVPFIIDLRRTSEYELSHIPNAVNIPVSLLASRRLPELGEVLVYGDGLGRVNEQEALAILSEKPGIDPVYLQGGYASWETQSGMTTGASGLQMAVVGNITYQTLKENEGEGAVLYDLRKGVNRSGPKESLLDHFPKATIGRGSPYALLRGRSRGQGNAPQSANGKGNQLLRGNQLDTDSLIVLIDDDQESAQKVAERMQAGGFKRVAVLIGGELILQHRGRPGLERSGGMSITLDPAPNDKNGNKPDKKEGGG